MSLITSGSFTLESEVIHVCVVGCSTQLCTIESWYSMHTEKMLTVHIHNVHSVMEAHFCNIRKNIVMTYLIIFTFYFVIVSHVYEINGKKKSSLLA